MSKSLLVGGGDSRRKVQIAGLADDIVWVNTMPEENALHAAGGRHPIVVGSDATIGICLPGLSTRSTRTHT